MTEIKNQRINLLSLYFLVPAICVISLLIYFVACFVLLDIEKKESIYFERAIYWLLVAGHLTLNLFVLAKSERQFIGL